MFQELLDHERRHWHSALPELATKNAELDQITAVHALTGATDQDELAEFMLAAPKFATESKEQEKANFAEKLLSLMIDGELLAPDRLVETHVANAIEREREILGSLLYATFDTPRTQARILTICARILATQRLERAHPSIHAELEPRWYCLLYTSPSPRDRG